jgi:hypothetical protein
MTESAESVRAAAGSQQRKKKRTVRSRLHAPSHQLRFPDLIMLTSFRFYSLVAVFVSTGLLCLSALQFLYAFQTGIKDIQHPRNHIDTDAVSPTESITAQKAQLSALPIKLNLNNAGSDLKDPVKLTLNYVIHGLEFLLLAPICYVVARSLLAYVAIKFVFAGQQNFLLRRQELQVAESALITSKAVIMGLLSGLIAVDIVSRFLESTKALDSSVWIMLAALVVIGVYYIALERLARSHSQQAHQDVSPPLNVVADQMTSTNEASTTNSSL